MTPIALSFSTTGLWNSTCKAAVGIKDDQEKGIRFFTSRDSGNRKIAIHIVITRPINSTSMAIFILRRLPRAVPRAAQTIQEPSIMLIAYTMLGPWSSRSMYQAKGTAPQGIIAKKLSPKSIHIGTGNHATAAAPVQDIKRHPRITSTAGFRPKESLIAPKAGPTKNWTSGCAKPPELAVRWRSLIHQNWSFQCNQSVTVGSIFKWNE